MELNFVNTNHPDFKLDEVIGTVMQKRAQQQQAAQAAEHEVMHCTTFLMYFRDNKLHKIRSR